VTLHGGATLTEPPGGGQQRGGAGGAADRLEPAPVERQRGDVEHVEPLAGQGLEFRPGEARALRRIELGVLPGGEGDELEPDAPEPERVARLGDLHLGVPERGTDPVREAQVRGTHPVVEGGIRTW